MEPWFKLYRGISREGLLHDEAALRVYVSLASRAATKKQRKMINGAWVHFNIGESIYSNKTLASNAQLTEHKTRSALDRLETMKLVTLEKKARKGSRARIIIPDEDFNSRGFVQFPRSALEDKRVFKNTAVLKVIIYLSITALHSDHAIEGRLVSQQGDVSVNRDNIINYCGISANMASSAINKLFKFSYLIDERHPNNSITFLSFVRNSGRIIQLSENLNPSGDGGLNGDSTHRPLTERAVTTQSPRSERTLNPYNRALSIEHYYKVNQPTGDDSNNLEVGFIAADQASAQDDNPQGLISVSSNNQLCAIPYDLSSWPSEPDPDLFNEFVQVFLRKTSNDKISQTYLSNLGPQFQVMWINKRWDVHACLRKMILRGWISIDPKFKEIAAEGGFIDQHSDRSWHDGVGEAGGEFVSAHSDTAWAKGF